MPYIITFRPKKGAADGSSQTFTQTTAASAWALVQGFATQDERGEVRHPDGYEISLQELSAWAEEEIKK